MMALVYGYDEINGTGMSAHSILHKITDDLLQLSDNCVKSGLYSIGQVIMLDTEDGEDMGINFSNYDGMIVDAENKTAKLLTSLEMKMFKEI